MALTCFEEVHGDVLSVSKARSLTCLQISVAFIPHFNPKLISSLRFVGDAVNLYIEGIPLELDHLLDIPVYSEIVIPGASSYNIIDACIRGTRRFMAEDFDDQNTVMTITGIVNFEVHETDSVYGTVTALASIEKPTIRRKRDEGTLMYHNKRLFTAY